MLKDTYRAYVSVIRDNGWLLVGPFVDEVAAADWGHRHGWGRGGEDSGDPRWQTLWLRDHHREPVLLDSAAAAHVLPTWEKALATEAREHPELARKQSAREKESATFAQWLDSMVKDEVRLRSDGKQDESPDKRDAPPVPQKIYADAPEALAEEEPPLDVMIVRTARAVTISFR